MTFQEQNTSGQQNTITMIIVELMSHIALSIMLGLLLIIIFHKLVFSRRKMSSKLPPGSMGWPLVGETLDLLKPHTSNSLGSFLENRILRHGKIFKSHLFGSPAIVSCDLEMNLFIVQNEEKLFITSYPKQMQGILGDISLLICSGELHKKMRHYAVSFNSESKTEPHFLNYVEKMILSMFDSWKECKQVTFCKEARQLTIKFMLKHLLSITSDEFSSSTIFEDVLTFMHGFVSLPIKIPGFAYAKAIKARARVSNTIKSIITGRRNGSNVSKWDFLDVILAKNSLNDEEIVSIVLDILLGGYETTATLMAIIVYFVGHAPNVLQHLVEEHKIIRGNKKIGEPLNLEDYKQMEFTHKVVYESLRCGNVVKFLHRKAIQDVEYKGVIIPSGWKVLPMLTAGHFDPSNHENPFEFNPWRWNDPQTIKKINPFGGGLRQCPGQELAKMEMAFFLHHFVLSYRWKLKDEKDNPIAFPYVEFRNGLQMEIEPLELTSSKET